MSKLSISVGILMIILGIGSFVLTGAASATALIPAFFGIAFIGLGVIGINKEAMRKHLMHAALLLAILGIGGSFGGLINVLGVLGGNELVRPNASYAQAAMAIICIYFVVAGIRSFINVRKNSDSEAEVKEAG